MSMKKPRLPLCLFAALVISACASVDQDRQAGPLKPEDGGTAKGEAAQARDVTKLTRAYVIAQTPKGKKAEEIRLVLTDGSTISPEVLASARKLTAAATAGEFQAVIVDFDAERKPKKSTFFMKGVPADMSVTDVGAFTPKQAAEGSLAGRVVFKDSGYSFRYSVDFDAPIYRPPQKPAEEVPANATAAERARSELRGQDLPFDKETFFKKVMANDTAAVALYLKAGMPADASPRTTPPLKDAVDRGNVELAKLLIAGGANVNYTGAYGQTLVMDAASRKDPRLLRALVAAGADVNKANTYGVAPLSSAAEQGILENVKILLKGKAKVNARDSGGSTALTIAVLRGYAEVVKTLIAAGADVKKDKTMLLEIANRENHADVAKIIKEAARE
jgi:hypothetical protein